MLDQPATHRLDALLAPKSLALVGASVRPDSAGNDMVRMAVGAGFTGEVTPINPKYETIEGLACLPSLADLPEPPDHVAIALGDDRLEAALAQAIEAGAKAATIFASGVDSGDRALPSRLQAMAREAGIEMCGINCMGFYNLDAGLRVCGFASPLDMTPGGIAWIAQSGSVFGALAHNDRRPRFNLCVSSGAETVTTAADYLDWSLHQRSTTVAALFLESVRKPELFERALADAAARDIPVVALKIGRTEASAAMALTHTGALAGDDGAYEALFRQYGVIRVRTMDEMAAVLLLLQDGMRAGPGALASMHDSGGEREMIADLAHDLQVPYAPLEAATVKRLRGHLDLGLKPENPLDAWGTGHGHEENYIGCLAALAEDPNVAVTCFFNNIRDDYYMSKINARATRAAVERTGKPIFLASNYAMVRHRQMAQALTDDGIPVIDGTEEALLAVRHLFAYRDFQARDMATPAEADPATVDHWRRRLQDGATLDEAGALDLLADFGIGTIAHAVVGTKEDAQARAREIGYPVVLKTANAAIHHKSDVGGVRLNIKTPDDLAAAYDDMAARLGPRVLIAAMAQGGVEIALGALFDPQFGPCVMVSAGGTLIELLDDKVFARAPIAASNARALLGELKIKRVLDGVRGVPPSDLDALAHAIERFSVMIAALGGVLSEADVNPLIVTPDGALAVDALIVPRGTEDA